MVKTKFNRFRNAILFLCSEQPIKMNDLEKQLKISRGSLRHHLNVLEKQNMIEPMERDETQQGRPTFIKLSKQYQEIFSKQQESLKNKELSILKKLGQEDVEVHQLIKSFDNTAYEILNNSTFEIIWENPNIELVAKITEKGKKFLEDSKE